MNIGTIIVLAVIAGICAAAAASLIRTKKRGGCSCAGSCAGTCAGCSGSCGSCSGESSSSHKKEKSLQNTEK